jgi:hypothetical protein
MAIKRSLSTATRNNWFIDAGLLIGALIASLSGIYFLFLPIGGYQGGRNPLYGVTVLFERSTWGDLHIWGSILMIAVAAVHITIHWNWITGMVKRSLNELFGPNRHLNNRSRFNIGINAVVGVSGLVTAITGIYLLFFPGGGHGVPDPNFIFTRTTWDLIHTWAGVAMIIAGVVHFAIHWKWVTKVTNKLFGVRQPVRETSIGTSDQSSKVVN